MIALRTQQILGFESGIADTADPLAGSYYIEALTDDVEAGARDLIAKIDELGGAVAAIEAGFQQDQIEDAAYEAARAIDAANQVVVGVNRFTVDEEPDTPVLVVDPALEQAQTARLAELRAARDAAAVADALGAVRAAAESDANLLYPMKTALQALATIGEISDVLREVFGTYGR